MHPIEAGAGVVLIVLALAWQRYSQAAKLLPGLALVLGVSLVVWGVTGG
ncbi:MAG TPA: hypothetical protein VN618_04835 [Solirubrobacteraceae bacterium]|nr:hypothetical protein [Solirubrobacteraceae bacterium]